MREQVAFKKFIEDESNIIAAEMCRKIVESPSQICDNPVWIFGQSGIGKTQLLKEIADALAVKSDAEHNLKNTAEAKTNTAYVTTEALIEGIISRIHGDSSAWDENCNAEILLIDNTERLAGMVNTQKEIANLCLKKHMNGQHIVIASMCPPDDLSALKQSLLENASTFAVSEIKLPSYALKCKYIELFLKKHPTAITNHAMEMLAYEAKTVAVLKGALQTAYFQSADDKQIIDSRWAKKYINSIYGGNE